MSDRPFKPLCYLTLHVILRITSICIASHRILTCITITLHSYMHHHHMAFLYVLPSCFILTCITITLRLYSLMHYHAFHFHHKKLISSLLSRNIKLSTRRTFRTPRMSQRAIDELQHGQELLRAEVKNLKSQMSLVMDLLQVVLKRECNTTPISASLVA